MDKTYQINPDITDPELLNHINIMIKTSDELRERCENFGYVMTLEEVMMIDIWRDDLEKNAHKYGYTFYEIIESHVVH
jgi:hypothetical protein